MTELAKSETPLSENLVANSGANLLRNDLRPNLIGMDRDDLIAAFAAMGEKKFRAEQVYQWVYQHGATDFAAMTSLSKNLRESLGDQFRIDRPGTSSQQISTDGTRKWLLRFDDAQEAETVFIPEPDRGTLCVSSQVGCTLTCAFCHTGTQRLVRNLEPGEIVGQIMTARDEVGTWPSSAVDRSLTNIVMMGMGEPLLNYDNMAKALRIAMDGNGLSLSKRKITVSTSGVVPEIRRLGAELGVMLAISLHAVRDDLRDELVPINRKYPLKELMAACREYPAASNARRVFFEYVMLKGVNDSPADARELVRLVKGIPAKFNLIPFNPWPGVQYECSSEATIKQFADILHNAGYVSTVRTPRGRDILAACGQLKSESVRQRRA
ncbi:MAG: 23S rRNA (adenine(2503)-C(2))-methyltransferase RlmN [Rhodospirillaceae bacterium]|jgi:23S rRNA (adenine2503-C2)-methyltransferase|nr:23S rRNA (adenine(2503)-C(2))-methyltransferase RlmN [Rhodospirillaceae bacterium]